MEVLDRVRRTISRHGLANRSTRVIAAVSGGSDSVALAHLLLELNQQDELSLVGIAHFNHQLRQAADDDEALVQDLAHRLGMPFFSGRGDVGSAARREGCSLEDAARRARLAFLEQARHHFQADVVATGHTRDDQAETFLLRLIRGAGPGGLGAMHPRRGDVIRPLLDCSRDQLLAYLTAHSITFVHDETNDDVSIARNRVRHELVPFLERFNPAIMEALAGEADIVREMWAWLESESQAVAPDLCRHEADGDRRMKAERLGKLPLPLARHIVHGAMTEAADGRTVTLAHVDRLLGLSRSPEGSFDAPGHRVERQGQDVVLTSRPPNSSGRWRPVEPNKFRYPLSIPGEALIAELDCVVSAEESHQAGTAILGSRLAAAVRRTACEGPFAVRVRQQGDRFTPFGMDRRKKLQDFFVDRKVAYRLRDRVPIVVDRHDRIVWVAGHTIDEAFRVTDPAEAVIIFRLKVLGGPA